MVGNINPKFSGSIVLPNGMGGGNIPAPGDISEDQFISLLNAGVYDSSYIGSIVTLSNTAYYNNGTWIIADVNHDSNNTGQTNCYDLISVNCIRNGSYPDPEVWRSGSARTWLNGTFYNGFSSDIKSHIMNIKYNNNGTWYNDDKIIIPSCTELNYSDTYASVEGSRYPVFTDNTSRQKYKFGTTDYYEYWTRTKDIYSVISHYLVYTDGSLGTSWPSTVGIVPIIRVS